MTIARLFLVHAGGRPELQPRPVHPGAEFDVQFARPLALETLEVRLDDDLQCASPASARSRAATRLHHR